MIDRAPRSLTQELKDMTKLSTQEVDTVIDQIGDMDMDQLNRVVDYIRDIYKIKRAEKNAKAAATLSVGARVRLQGIKPQYLIGLTGEVIEKKNSRFLVKLDRGPTKKFQSGTVLCTPACLEKI